MKVWLTAGGFALAFLTVGFIFATREDLGEMDQIASVGSFALALITVAVTTVAAVRRRREEPLSPADSPGSSGGFRVGPIIGAKSVQIGHGTQATVNAASQADDD